MLAGLAARSLWHCNRHWGSALLTAPAAARQPVQHAPAARARPAVQAHSMAVPADGGAPTELEVAKRRVREEVKAALRQLSAEQMAEESECGWRFYAKKPAGGGVNAVGTCGCTGCCTACSPASRDVLQGTHLSGQPSSSPPLPGSRRCRRRHSGPSAGQPRFPRGPPRRHLRALRQAAGGGHHRGAAAGHGGTETVRTRRGRSVRRGCDRQGRHGWLPAHAGRPASTKRAGKLLWRLGACKLTREPATPPGCCSLPNP